MAEKRKTKGAAYTRLFKSLKSNLEARGLVEPIYADLVEEYMNLWTIRQALKEDIEERGVTIYDEKRGMEVENRSVSLAAQISSRMLQIYTSLGFRDAATSAQIDPEDDDEL